MAEKQVVHELYPDTNITLALFRDVENAKEVRQAVMSGQFDAALLKATMIPDPFLVLVAANKAVHSQRLGKMTTKTVHSEVLYNLSPSRKITESFKRFGISDTDTSVFIAIIQTGDSGGDTLQKVKETIRGQQINIDDLHLLADSTAVQKEYKLSEKELASCSAVDAIVSRIASKDIVTV